MTTFYFTPLEQADYQQLAQAAYLKGLLHPFKGKGSLTSWANHCAQLRDELIQLSSRQILAQARSYPFNLLPVQLAQQVTAAGTSFLRWRNVERTVMGVAAWESLLASPSTPVVLLNDLLAMEQQRIVLNLQISLAHTLARQARDCASKWAHAEAIYHLHDHPSMEQIL